MGASSGGQMVDVAGRRLKVTNLDKVLYPETGTTKADVLRYYAEVAHVLVPQAALRPATRKRWVSGVGTAEEPGQVFFRKDLEDSAPEWVPRAGIQHKDHVNTYPLVNDPAVLAWFGQVAALEIHVPQWRFSRDHEPLNPDRMVLDLDPGEGAGLAECAEVALLCRGLLADMGLQAVPVTSGSKGIHLYAPLDGRHTTEQVSEVAHELARSLETDHPDLVVSSMKKVLRTGKVLVDWSQNNGNKTTICPYSLRGRSHPTVAAPRTWEEIQDPKLRQLDLDEVLERVAGGLDPIADQGWHGAAAGRVSDGDDAGTAGSGGTPADRLATYRGMRDAAKTPEPVPAEPPAARELAEGELATFVVQEHHARRLHWDFRLEHSGVLVSWAVPKGPPLDPSENRLAVMTEDHPLDYGGFEGSIPKGEYGAGDVTIWDAGTYELEKWREGKEVIVVLHGRSDGGFGGVPRRYALINAPGMGDKKNWLIHLMKEQPEPGAKPGQTAQRHPGRHHAGGGAPGARGSTASAPSGARPEDAEAVEADPGELPEPMLAAAGKAGRLDPEEDWAFEMKWDGVRAIAGVRGGRVTLVSRNGNDMTRLYPELQELAGLGAGGADLEGAVFDGEIVALNGKHRPSFGLLQSRMKLATDREIAAAAEKVPVHLMVFDALRLPAEGDGVDGGGAPRALMRTGYRDRRRELFAAVVPGKHVHLPDAHTGAVEDAIESSLELGLEGVIAKKADGTYAPGRRSRNWVKIKNESHQEVVVIGWRRGAGGRSGGIGSLLVAVNDGGSLTYAGRVGTGFSDADLRDAAKRLARLERKTPAADGVPEADRRDAVWVSPSLVGEVRYAERTDSGRLRHAVWRGWRPDKDAADVRWETSGR